MIMFVADQFGTDAAVGGRDRGYGREYIATNAATERTAGGGKGSIG